jgi:hypothetical protein
MATHFDSKDGFKPRAQRTIAAARLSSSSLSLSSLSYSDSATGHGRNCADDGSP